MGSAFLLFAGGMNALILPIRGAGEGFSVISLGLLGTAWASGHIVGCLATPTLVSRVGHIRSFSVVCACAGLAVLISLLIVTPWIWIPVRALSGFCFSSAAMIVEGWLGERTQRKSRGAIFGIYMSINLAATTAGQMVLALGDPMGHLFFVLAAMFYMMALIPTAVSSSAAPRPLVHASLNLKELYANSPVAIVTAFFVGVSNGAFGTLAAVYAIGLGLDLFSITLFVSLPLLAGAAAQVPVGLMSDRFDRRIVLVAMAIVALGAELTFLLGHFPSNYMPLISVSILGAGIYTMYPIILAHANDHPSHQSYVLTSGGLLLVFGVGAIFGPLIAGALMQGLGFGGLFVTTSTAHVIIVAYALQRMFVRSPIPLEDKSKFVFRSPGRLQTPQTDLLTPTSQAVEEIKS